MKKELAQEIINWLQNGKEFALTQAPEYIQQYLQYTLFCEKIALYVGIGLLLLAVFCFTIELFSDNFAGGAAVFGILLFIFGTIGTVGGSIGLYKVKYAPKVLLLQHFTNLVHK